MTPPDGGEVFGLSLDVGEFEEIRGVIFPDIGE
jgi:hypothetical protein